jgi:hypothetical protein
MFYYFLIKEFVVISQFLRVRHRHNPRKNVAQGHSGNVKTMAVAPKNRRRASLILESWDAISIPLSTWGSNDDRVILDR